MTAALFVAAISIVSLLPGVVIGLVAIAFTRGEDERFAGDKVIYRS
jgi:hypothetical protein